MTIEHLMPMQAEAAAGVPRSEDDLALNIAILASYSSSSLVIGLDPLSLNASGVGVLPGCEEIRTSESRSARHHAMAERRRAALRAGEGARKRQRNSHQNACLPRGVCAARLHNEHGMPRACLTALNFTIFAKYCQRVPDFAIGHRHVTRAQARGCRSSA